MRRYEIADEQWRRIENLLPGKKSDAGRSADNNRLFMDAVLWIAHSGASWRDLPERLGKWNSIFQRLNRWAKRDRWAGIFEALQQPDLERLMLDSTVIRAQQHAAGQKNGG